MGNNTERAHLGLHFKMRKWSRLDRRRTPLDDRLIRSRLASASRFRPTKVVIVTVALLATALTSVSSWAAAAGENQAPVARADLVRTDKGATVYQYVLGNDFDPDGDSIWVVGVTDAVHGTVSFNSSYVYYTPDANFTGSETLTYTLQDSNGLESTAPFTVWVDTASSQTDLRAWDDYFVVTAGESFGFTAGQLTSNDVDPERQPLEVVGVVHHSNVAAGLSGSPASGFTYSTAAGFTGTDQLDYLVRDPDGHVAMGRINILVVAADDTNQAPVARADLVRTDKGATVYQYVLGNDFDPDGDSIWVVGVTDAVHGTANFNSSYVYYTPDANFTGSETLTYTLQDAHGLLTTGTLTVWVDTASPPTDLRAWDDYFVVTAGESFGFTAGQLTSNDVDPERQPLEVVGVVHHSNVAAGLSGSPASGFTYSTAAGFTGTDQLDYLVRDPDGHVAMARINILVVAADDTNQAPVAVPDTVESPSGDLVYQYVLGNDFDPDGDSIWVVGVANAVHGTASFNSSYVYYTPDANFTGSEKLTYTLQDAHGLLATSTLTIVVRGGLNQAPVANTQYKSVSLGGKLNIAFTGSDPEGSPITFSVTRNPLGAMTGSGANWTYTAPATPGRDVILFKANDGSLNSGEAAIFITVSDSGNREPVAVATATPTLGSPPLAVAFDGTGSSDPDGTIVSYEWNFGDGSTGVGASPSHTYTTVGSYAATLTVVDNDGLVGTDTVQVLVTTPNQAPTAVASASPTSGVAPLVVSFDGSGSSDPDGTIVSFAWNFGDGGSGVGAKPSHTYATPGTYTATLTVTDNDGLTATDSVTVSVSEPEPEPQAPTAVASASPTSGVAPLAVAFDGSGSSDPDGTIVSFEWNFGDGSSGIGAKPSHTYTTAGTYTATLTVVDDDGLTSTDTVTITVSEPEPEPQAPTAVASASPTSGVAPLAVAFDGSGSSDPDGMIVSFEWNFGDGGSGIGAKPSHTYATAGTYTATLTVVDDDGLTSTDTVTVTVSEPEPEPQAPTAVASASPTSGVAPLAVSFDGSGSSDPDGTIVSFEWNFGDGSSGVGAKPSHTYATAGTYTATLTVTDNDGLTATDSVTVSVSEPEPEPQAPTAVASADPVAGVAPLAVAFDGSGSSDPDGTIVSFEWNFGDGSSGIGAKPSHTYTTAGTYTATLTVVDDDGLTSTDTVTVTVSEPEPEPQAPTAVASASPTSGVAPLAVSFNGSGSSDPDGTIVSYEWDFGDGGSGVGAKPSHTYTTAGTYTATLTVTDNDGLTATDSVTVKVDPTPPQPQGDKVTIKITGAYTYSLTGNASSGDIKTVTDRLGVVSVKGTVKVGTATVTINLQRLWLLPVYTGQITINDPVAGIRNVQAPVVQAGYKKPSGQAGTVSGSASWFVLRGFRIEPFTIQWSVTDG